MNKAKKRKVEAAGDAAGDAGITASITSYSLTYSLTYSFMKAPLLVTQALVAAYII